MARFRSEDVDHYGGQGGAGYFSLKNDKDVAQVRIMYDTVEDVQGYSVHQVEIGEKKRYVNCLREYNQPIDNCPFCKERMFTTAKLFVPIYNLDEDRVQVWERGKKFFAKMTSLCARYPHLVSHVFEIERNGKAGDQTTTYELYEIESDNTTLEDLPEVPEVLGSVVLDKTAEEMEEYLETGEFPDESSEQPVRRRQSKRRDEEEAPFEEEERPRRRTPESRGRRTPARGRGSEDTF